VISGGGAAIFNCDLRQVEMEDVHRRLEKWDTRVLQMGEVD
jgi:hypothetical protein